MIIAGYLKEIGYRPRGLVHVGGHCGQEMQAYCDLGIDCLIWVEADPATANRLRDIVATSAWNARQHVIEALITNTDGDELQLQPRGSLQIPPGVVSQIPPPREAGHDDC